MRTALPITLCIAVSLAACSNNMGQSPNEAGVLAYAEDGDVPASQRPGNFTEGKDYVVMERRRFLDEQGFDRPVEAFSVLCPKAWKSEGGVQWKSAQACRSEMVSWVMKVSSPDGKVQFEQLPARGFSWADDQMMMQTMMTGAQAGGCAVNQPFSAEQYIQGFAQQDLGAQASEIVADDVRMAFARQLDQQANAVSMQYGTGTEQSTTYAKGKLKWPDGTEGFMEAGVTNSITRKPDLFTGGMSSFSSTQVFYSTVTRFPAERKAEAEQVAAVITRSHRVNPVWKQAKENFLTQLGNMEHAGRMDRIRLMGEQAQAYAKSQGEGSDRQMRNWERQQASNDQQHERAVKTIREVETWNDGSNGRVELTSGYDHAWSRGDGSYVLTNSPNFDPSSVFQDQNWKPMQQTP